MISSGQKLFGKAPSDSSEICVLSADGSNPGGIRSVKVEFSLSQYWLIGEDEVLLWQPKSSVIPTNKEMPTKNFGTSIRKR